MMTFQENIGYCFTNQDLLEQALTHKSYFNESNCKLHGHNEKLEFLGDAVLDLCLGLMLYQRYPQLNEGELSKVRASLVNESALMNFSKNLQLNEKMKLGKGELNSGGKEKPRLLASVFEAFLGAIFLDGGFDKAYQFVSVIFEKAVEEVDLENHFSTDFKTRLQEKTQELHKATPVYKVISQDGPDHEKIFCIEVYIKDQKISEGKGKSKKQAEQAAAQLALEIVK